MASRLHRTVDGDLFRPAREQFDQMVRWLTSPDAPVEHSVLEDGISERGQEVMRLLYQGHLDQLSARERKEATEPEEGVAVRPRSRQLESKFGRVQLRRLGHKAAGERVRYPLDERLNLPADLYSHPVRRRMAQEAQRGSWQQAVENVGETTAAHVPKRQAEEITVRAAQDFDTFYAERAIAANDVSKDAMQALSCDSTGITMRPESLRDATCKQAQAAAEAEVRGDPMGDRKLRKHDKRMAVVTAVWEQERQVRTARQIVDNLQRRRSQSRQRDKKDKPPKPQNKRVWANIESSQATAIAEMFDEAERRDPSHARTTVVLVDGEKRQIEAVEQQARARTMSISIVLDIIHVLHYLWLAAMAMCGKNEQQAEKWVAAYLFKLLTRPALDVVAGIRQAATLRGLTAKQRRPIEKCAQYLLNNAQYVRYSEFLAQGFPIATGVIEGGCRHLVKDRMEITGARWNLPGAEAVLRLRALRASADWDDYWSYHLSCESKRNYARAA
jgi:hypothetical protein